MGWSILKMGGRLRPARPGEVAPDGRWRKMPKAPLDPAALMLARNALWRYVDCEDCLKAEMLRQEAVCDHDAMREALRALCDRLSMEASPAVTEVGLDFDEEPSDGGRWDEASVYRVP